MIPWSTKGINMKLYVWMNLIIYGGGMISQIKTITNSESTQSEKTETGIGLGISIIVIAYSIALLLTM